MFPSSEYALQASFNFRRFSGAPLCRYVFGFITNNVPALPKGKVKSV
jgi:hypothetical protein